MFYKSTNAYVLTFKIQQQVIISLINVKIVRIVNDKLYVNTIKHQGDDLVLVSQVQMIRETWWYCVTEY